MKIPSSTLSSPLLQLLPGAIGKVGSTPGFLRLLQGRRGAGGLDSQCYSMASVSCVTLQTAEVMRLPQVRGASLVCWCLSCWGSLGDSRLEALGKTSSSFFSVLNVQQNKAGNFSSKYLTSYISFRQAEEK